jgi:hypothetical protein
MKRLPILITYSLLRICTANAQNLPPNAPSFVDIKVTNYPVPGSNAYYVAPNGSSSNTGDINSPWDVATAVSKAPAGSTIIFRAGTYRNINDIPIQKRLTLQPYPKEKAWIKGSMVVTGQLFPASLAPRMATMSEADTDTEPVEVYPNTATDYVEVKNIPANTTVHVMDIHGRIVHYSVVNSVARISLTAIPAGTYLIQFRNTLEACDGNIKFNYLQLN